MAINPFNPQNVIVSAAKGAWRAHYFNENTESFLYRRSIKTNDDESEKWSLVTDGLPDSKGNIISMLAANPKINEEFYCLNNHGIFSSKDSGDSWSQLNIQ